MDFTIESTLTAQDIIFLHKMSKFFDEIQKHGKTLLLKARDVAERPGNVRLRRPEWNVDIRTVRARQGSNIEKRAIHRMTLFSISFFESTRRDSNPRPSPWQGDTPPLSHSCIGNIPSKPHIELHQPLNLHLTFLDKPSTD